MAIGNVLFTIMKESIAFIFMSESALEFNSEMKDSISFALRLMTLYKNAMNMRIMELIVY